MLRLELRASRTAIRRALARLRDTTPPGGQVRHFNDEGTDCGKGRLWGVSAVAEFVDVYYNKEKFSAMGGELPSTFEEFEALLAMAKDAGELPIQLGNAEGWPALHVYGMVQAAYRPAPAHHSQGRAPRCRTTPTPFTCSAAARQATTTASAATAATSPALHTR